MKDPNQPMFFPQRQNQPKTTRFNEHIPLDPQEFYRDFGLITHPNTGRPVPALTAYQVEVWKANKYRYRLVVKSQKVGLSTSVLMELFQHALTDCRGYELLIISQTADAAKEHLYTLRSMIRGSAKYSKYLITTQQEGLSRDEATKATVMYLHNPDNPNKPTRIIAKGPAEQGIWSWKNVKFIMMSDVAVAPKVDISPTINAAMTRLANTNGSIIIETPPRAPYGKIYDMYRQSYIEPDKSKPEGQFKVIPIRASQAVEAGVMTEEFLEGEKLRLGSQFPMYYEAEFVAGGGDIFDPPSVDAIIKDYDLKVIGYSGINIMGIDPAFGHSSKFGICIINSTGNPQEPIRVIYAAEHETDYDSIMDEIRALRKRYDIRKIIIDPSAPEVVKGLKIDVDEDLDWEAVMHRAKKNGWNWHRLMQVWPLAFSKYGREMLAHTKGFVDRGKVNIHPDFKDLIASLHTATEKVNGLGVLDKTRTKNNDVFDSFRLALHYFEEDKETVTR